MQPVKLHHGPIISVVVEELFHGVTPHSRAGCSVVRGK